MAVSRCNSVGAQLMLGIALLTVSYLMLTPEPPHPQMLDFNQSDKLEHLISFLILAFLADVGWAESGFVARKYLPLLGYAIVIESLQYFVPGREVSSLDLLANASGLLLYGLFISPLLRRLAIR